MLVKFDNKYNLTENQVGIPFMIKESPIGVISKVTSSDITVNVFDKFIGFEIESVNNPQVIAIYLSDKEQNSYEETMMNIKLSQIKNNCSNKCIVCGKELSNSTVKICSECASQYKF